MARHHGAVFFVAILSACSSFESEPQDQASPPSSAQDGGSPPVHGQPARGISLTATTPAPVYVVQNVVKEIPLDLARQEGTDGAVTVKVTSTLPKDVTIPDVVIPPGGKTGTLKVTAAKSSAQGPFEISLEARADDGQVAAAKVAAFVRGAPGSLDTTFGTNGVILHPSTATGEDVHEVRALDSGLLAIGRQYDNAIIVTKFDDAGKLDSSFGTDGIVSFGTAQAFATLDVVPSGASKGVIYVLVRKGTATGDGTVYRIGPDGKAVGTFPAAGVALTRTLDVAALPSGDAFVLLGEPPRVEHLKSDGTLDTAYDCKLGTSTATYGRLLLRADGSALVLANAMSICGPAGHDTSLGTAPYYTTTAPLGGVGILAAAATAAGGGVFLSISNSMLAWSRVDAKGTENTPGLVGAVDAFTTRGTSDTAAILSLSDGSVLIGAGKANDLPATVTFARYTPAGAADATFGSAGMVTTELGGSEIDVTAMRVDSIGRAIVATMGHNLLTGVIARMWL